LSDPLVRAASSRSLRSAQHGGFPVSPICILVCALGGEGGGVLSQWLVDAARRAGYAVQSTSIPGVAQRTGATTYYVELYPVPLAQLGGRRPVFSLYPVPGELDLLVSSELLETARQIGLGLATAQRTCIVSSSARTLTTLERMQLGDGRLDGEPLTALVRRHSREHHMLDMTALTREAGTVLSAVMFGAIAACGLLPLSRAQCEEAIRAGDTGADASLRGFARGFDAVASGREQPGPMPHAVPAQRLAPGLPNALVLRFPLAVQDVVGRGHAHVRDYQDGAYADLYARRLEGVLDAEHARDPSPANGYATTREAARWLALWMAFDDIVRVADLKSRAARHARVRAEVQALDGELLRIVDHFKPGMPEFAGLLPERLSDALVRWDRRRQMRGREPLALPLRLATHSVCGLLVLRLLAGLKGLRRRGSRYAQEQVLIERWLAAVVQGARTDPSLGEELAKCGRLIKGYGSTNERGKANLLHIVEHLGGDAAAVRATREAALLDEAGQALEQALRQHGVPPRPAREQPIRWVKRRPGVAGKTPV
jgi:indolepyruvate ferredoxin oxidoreductase beta subunit